MRLHNRRAKIAARRNIMNVITQPSYKKDAYLFGFESSVAFLDFSGIDLKLSCPTLDQVLLENSQSRGHGQALELAIVVILNGEFDFDVVDLGEFGLGIDVFLWQMASDKH